MKSKKVELDIAFIGSEIWLTNAEKSLIVEYFSKWKDKFKIYRSTNKPIARRTSNAWSYDNQEKLHFINYNLNYWNFFIPIWNYKYNG